jgi:D-erythro-7,8-dihydroneopterin triphosphate epimerase
MDRILISDLAARCLIGVNEDERREKQDVIINLTVWADLRRAGVSDKFEDTVDYRDLKKRLLAMVEKSEFFLLEALAEAIAQECLADKRIEQVQVRVDKPLALRHARSVAVEINRLRGA